MVQSPPLFIRPHLWSFENVCRGCGMDTLELSIPLYHLQVHQSILTLLTNIKCGSHLGPINRQTTHLVPVGHDSKYKLEGNRQSI